MGFSFSPHFSHRWANTSKLIRQAIATELRDVIELLQPETDLNEFEFTYPDLIAHIDQLERDLQNNIDHESSHYASRSETSNLIKPNQPSSKHPLSASQYVQHNAAQKRHLQAQNKQPENAFTDNSVVKDDMEWISGLEVRIDEYLSENMYKMSNELKTWLRAEIKQQLAVNHK